MPISWAIAGVDLHLDERPPARGRRAWLEHALRDAVTDGRLAQGVRLPSSRILAKELGMARNTVAHAYGRLVEDGYLVARRGAGTVVAPRPLPAGGAPAPVPRPPAPRHDLRPGRPDLSDFPRARWVAATRRAMATAERDAFWPDADRRGRIELRTALAAYLGRARGVRTDAGRVVVFSGYPQALSVLAHALGARGARRMALEDPGLPFLRGVVERTGLEVARLPVDEGGAVPELVEGRVDAVVLTPAHQYPLGMTLGPARRSEVVRWAAATGTLVVEDDYDGEFRYDREPAGALQGLDPGRVVYAGTASKTLSPGVRLAWLALPAWLVDDVLAVKRRPELSVGTLDQLAFAAFLDSGDLDRHVRRVRLKQRARRDRLVAALAREVPAVEVTGIAAGLHAFVRLPAGGPPERVVMDLLTRRDIAVHPLAWHRPGGGGHPRGPAPDAGAGTPAGGGGLVVGYAAPPDSAFGGTLDALVTALAEVYPKAETGGTGR